MDEFGLSYVLHKIKSYISEAVKNAGGQDVYSTEEQQIGTWIDGKPLYRKVYNWTGSYNINENRTVQVVGPIPAALETLVYCYGKMHTSYLNSTEFVPYVDLAIGASASFDIYQNNVTLINKWNSSQNVDKIIAILLYTKTTDQPQT